MSGYVFVPPKEVPFLTGDEVIRQALRDPLIEDIRKEITSLSLIVSKNWQALPSLIRQINNNPDSASELADILRSSPESFFELAGFKIFGFKSLRRVKAERHVFRLSLAIHKYGYTVKNVKDAVIYRNSLERVRCARKILMPNDNVQYLIALSHDELCNVFKNQDTFQLDKEVWLFLNSVEMRLSENELQMLEENQSQPLAESIGISDDQALKLIDVVTKAKKVLEEINLFQRITYNLNESQVQKLRSEQEGIYENYNPRKAQTQNLKSEEENIYENYNPRKAQTQNLKSEEENIYENYNPRKAQTQNSKRFLILVKALAPLTRNEVINKIKIDPVVQEYAEKVQDLSELVFRNRELLNNYLTQIIKNPQLGETYSQKLKSSPESFFELAGFKIFGFKSLRRVKAENNVPELCKAIKEYAKIVEMHQKQILKNYEKEQEQIHKSIVMPSNKIQHLLNLPSDMRKNILREKNTSQINKELFVFLNQVNFRLSMHERMAIKENDYQTLASSIKVSGVQAQKIINLVKEAKTCRQEIKDIISSQKKRPLAIAI